MKDIFNHSKYMVESRRPLTHNYQMEDNILIVGTYDLRDGDGERLYKTYDNKSISSAAISRLRSKLLKEIRKYLQEIEDGHNPEKINWKNPISTVRIFRGREADYVREKLIDVNKGDLVGNIDNFKVRIEVSKMGITENQKVTLTIGQLKRLVKECRTVVNESYRHYTQKELRQMVRSGDAIDITNYSLDQAKELRSRGYDIVGVCTGTYGLNGALLEMKDTGDLCALICRNTILSYLI